MVDGNKCMVYYPKVVSALDESKNSKDGVKAVLYWTRFIPINNISFFNGSLKVYQLILKFLSARHLAEIICPRFFLGVCQGKKVLTHEFFKNQSLGRNTCSRIVRTVCRKLNIRGNGEACYMTTHGLLATMISLLISAGYSDAAVVLCSVHRDNSSL